LLLATAVFGCSKKIDVVPQPPAAASATVVMTDEAVVTQTVAELRKTKVISGKKYFSSDYGGGTWRYDSLNTKADNTGTILVTQYGQRLKRVYSGPVLGEWFGLIGDGSDETVQLQAAINASSGKTLQMPAGCFFTKQLVIVSNLTIIGNNTKLRMIQGSYDNTMIKLRNVSNVKIEKLELALNGISGNIWDGTSAMELQNCTAVQIDHCFIHDNTYVGIRLIGGNSNIRINNNTIENTDTGVHANNTNTNINIVSNTITKGTSEGITVYGYTKQNIPSNFLIDSNVIQDKANSFGINIPYAKLGTITHNTIQNCLGGITLHDIVSVGAEGFYTTDMIIKNNAIYNTNFGIIYVGDRTIVANNIISNVQQDGINVNNYDNPLITTTGVTVSNNTITNAGQNTGGRGGISVKNLLNSAINNNTISQCSKSFAIRFNGLCNGLKISNNDCADGMLQSNNTLFSDNITVVDNTFSNTYFPVAYPLNYKFALIAQSTKYTIDTTFNTAPDAAGKYSDINSFCVRTRYTLAAGTITNIVSSWVGRNIILFSTNSVTVKHGNNIRLKNGVDAAIPANKSVTLRYDGSVWKEINRNF